MVIPGRAKPKNILRQIPTGHDRVMNIPFPGRIKHEPIQHLQGRRILLVRLIGVIKVIQHLQNRIHAIIHQTGAPAHQAGVTAPRAGAIQALRDHQGVAERLTQRLPDHRAAAAEVAGVAEQADRAAVLQVANAADNSIHPIYLFLINR